MDWPSQVLVHALYFACRRVCKVGHHVWDTAVSRLTMTLMMYSSHVVAGPVLSRTRHLNCPPALAWMFVGEAVARRRGSEAEGL